MLEEHWSRHPELKGIPILQASGVAKKALSVFQTYVGMMNQDIQRAVQVCACISRCIQCPAYMWSSCLMFQVCVKLQGHWSAEPGKQHDWCLQRATRPAHMQITTNAAVLPSFGTSACPSAFTSACPSAGWCM